MKIQINVLKKVIIFLIFFNIIVFSINPVLGDDYNFTLNSGEKVISKYLNKGETLKISYVASGLITLYFMDSANYANYQNNEAVYNIEYLRDYAKRSFSYTAEESDTYYFVFKTTGSGISVTLTLNQGGGGYQLSDSSILVGFFMGGTIYLLILLFIGHYLFGFAFSYGYSYDTATHRHWGLVNVPENTKARFKKHSNKYWAFLLLNGALFAIISFAMLDMTN